MSSREGWEARIEALSGSAQESVASAKDLESLEAARLSLLGRSGRLTTLLKELKDLSIEDKRDCGPRANALRDSLQAAVDAKRAELERAAVEAAVNATNIDRSLPSESLPRGRAHPISETISEMAAVLSRLGFTWADGPLIETERYNFEALNIPEDHSSRDMQDTFYLAGAPLLMRTHTSPVQIRYMEQHKPPIRIMAPGRVFRHEAVDATHSAVFHQIEGLYIDKGVTMADLKGTLQALMRGLFGPKTEVRFRPSYFPFTEPSAEIDVTFRGRWLEMGGAGVVNPAVLKGAGLDPAEWSGFAFGVGVERVSMVRREIPDIRMFYENDLRFLEQFG